ncbi:MAG: glycoside hydrolase family 95 protein, partial [Planctomycetes bacterium]|nr:glycoside hydrolase family 95 protein [Planctomycetota bacterium]
MLSSILWAQTGGSDAAVGDMRLWYDRPAEVWVEALPVGNGSLGGMVFGGIEKEHVQFNHDTLWTGIPHDYSNPRAFKNLAEIRQLLLEDRQRQAERLAGQTFMSIPLRQERYQPFGDLWIEFEGTGDVSGYQRDLNLDTAVASVQYKKEGVTFTRSVFSSFPDKAMVIRLTADQPGMLNISVSLSTPHQEAEVVTQADALVLKGRVSGYEYGRDRVYHPSILKFESRLKVYEHNGNIEQVGIKLRLTNADAVTLVLTGATSFVNFNDVSGDPALQCESVLGAIEGSYEVFLKRHLVDYQNLYRRVEIDLGMTEEAARPTDERIMNFSKGNDPHLAALLFQYSRYLLIACSRAGSQPANLQGLWNDQLEPPWESKYTTNINAEMNYWTAEMTNLSECHEPLFGLIEDCAWTGRKVAKLHYDNRGWVLHHNTDIWRGAAPINASNHGIWATGGAWLCQHLWWHYEFTQDEEFLRERGYPIMKEAAFFFVDYLIEDPRTNNGWLISGPSNSPEIGGLVMGPTMDHQIIRNLFSNCIAASEVLGIDEELRN